MLLLATLGSGALGAAPRSAGFADQEVIAVFLFNFAHFVTWPESAFAGPDSPLRYCVGGRTPVARLLTEVIRDERVGKRPLQMRQLDDLADLNQCHIVYLSGDDRDGHSAAIELARGRAMLTVGAVDDFAAAGGMITLISRGKRLRPMINKQALELAGLKVSSKLLRVAIVTEG